MQPIFDWAKAVDASGVFLRDLRRLSMKIIKLDEEYYDDSHGKIWADICRDLGDK